MQLTNEQIEFLKQHNFHLNSEEHYPFVTGIIGRNSPEFYNIDSINELINEIKTYGKPLDISGGIQYKDLDDNDLWVIDPHKIQFIDIDHRTKKLKLPLQKPFTLRKRLICFENEDYYCIVGRYTGDFGDYSQYTSIVFKSIEVAEKELMPILEKQKNQFLYRISLIDSLLEKYK